MALLHAALLDSPGELLLDPADPLVELVLVDLADHDVVSGLRRDLRDTVAHQAAAHHAELAYLH